MNTMYKLLGKQTLQILFCKSQDVRLMNQIVTIFKAQVIFQKSCIHSHPHQEHRKVLISPLVVKAVFNRLHLPVLVDMDGVVSQCDFELYFIGDGAAEHPLM